MPRPGRAHKQSGLPVLKADGPAGRSGHCGPVRPSKRGRWRAKVALSLSNWPAARKHLEAAMREEPWNGAIARAWAGVLRREGSLERVIADAEHSTIQDRANRFARMILYREAGRDGDADALAAEFPEPDASH